jgi:phosphoserine/homoserine phosphotransferase
MLKTAEKAILFRPPDNVKVEFPQFPITTNYQEMKREIQEIINH